MKYVLNNAARLILTDYPADVTNAHTAMIFVLPKTF
jgi:hypothetical protein